MRCAASTRISSDYDGGGVGIERGWVSAGECCSYCPMTSSDCKWGWDMCRLCGHVVVCLCDLGCIKCV